MTKQNKPTTEPARFHRLKRLRIVGGFLDQTDFDFDKNLNCLIGPRGSGKSTVIELIRFGFDLGPSEGENPISRRRFDSLIKGNLGDGRIEMEVETKEGLTYTIRRELNEDPVILDESGEPTELDLHAGALFRPEIFSQNDVESIADQPSFQLDLLDSFCFDAIENANRLIRQNTNHLNQNAMEVRQVEEQVERFEEEVKTLPAVLEKLKGLAQIAGANSEEVNKAHEKKSARDKEQTACVQANNMLIGTQNRIAYELETIRREAAAVYPVDVQNGTDNLVNLHKTRFNKAIEDAYALIYKAWEELGKASSEIEKIRGVITLEHQKLDLEFQALMERFKSSTAQSKERVEFEKRKNQLELRQRELNGLKEKRKKLLETRQEILDRLSEQQDKRFNIRHGVATRITDALKPNIKVTVVQNGERGGYKQKLTGLLANAGIRHIVVASSIAQEVPPGELADIVKAENVDALTVRAEINPDQATKVIRCLGTREALMELEGIFLDDQPKIELKDGQHFKDSRDLSTGQKCTTILPILLLESVNPLLIDQPEDNLDNSFVYSDVVKNIRSVKQKRQLLFVTHNPNIPVLGDAEQVFVLQSTGRSATVAKTGTVDGCRNEIVKLLEGGEEAFRMRGQRYFKKEHDLL